LIVLVCSIRVALGDGGKACLQGIQLAGYGLQHNSANFINLKLFYYNYRLIVCKLCLNLLDEFDGSIDDEYDEDIYTIKLYNYVSLNATQITRSYKVSSDKAMVRRNAA
jgi:hypothetical protein